MQTRMTLGRAHLPSTKVFRRLSGRNQFKTTARSSLANMYMWDFPDVKLRVSAQVAGSLGKAAKFHSLYDIRESNLVLACGL